MERGISLASRKQTFIQGAMILLVAGLLNRLLGFIPRIALPRMIGAEGVGLFQLVYPFTIVLLTLIAGGIPLAVAKLVAEAQSRDDHETTRRVVRIAISLALFISITSAAVCIGLAEWISTYVMTDARVHSAFLMMIPMLPLVAVSSVWRGYYQGIQNMLPPAISQTTETMFRIVLTLLLAWLLLPYGLEAAAAGAVLGMVVGELAGLWALWIPLRREQKSQTHSPPTPKSNNTDSRTLRSILSTAIPVTGSKMIGSLSYLLESILTARSLVISGIATSVATAQYGALQGMVIPLLLLPGALTYSLAVSLVPALSEAASRSDWSTIHLRLHQSMRLAVITGAPFIVLMGLLASPLCLLLYGDDSMANMLRWLAPIAIFLYMQAPLQAALQALNRPGTALFNTFIGAAIKLILIIQLATRPEYGIIGAVIAIGVNMLLVTLLHWISVARLTGFRLQSLVFLKIAFATVVMSAVTLWIWDQRWLGLFWLDLAAASIIATVCYLLILIALRLIDRHDVARIPYIGKLFR
ncbi:MAG: stage V sporulation protein B [Candidatus Cohnella colombiensis]|uniref:Stage V sporulation protein B n=1 Tax=Candidatus Cohnella colombiensis TaxID=3121368 RepID=A0AA95EZ05_9BACL|nr:MAG: stage V sporulation protein B [Cohnella sp.]